MLIIEYISHVFDTIFFHLTLAHKFHIDISNVGKISLERLFVEKRGFNANKYGILWQYWPIGSVRVHGVAHVKSRFPVVQKCIKSYSYH